MRSTAFARLLGDRVELARQTIYFAESSTLNDPAEAIRGFVWRGDTIAWTSLFRHYVNCLHHIYLLMRLSESNQRCWRSHSRFDPESRSLDGCAGLTGVSQRRQVRSSPLRDGLMAVRSSVADLLPARDLGGGEAFGEGLDFF